MMAPSDAAMVLFQQDLQDNLNKVEELIKENQMLDKKKEENLMKIKGLIHKAKIMRIGDYLATEEDDRDESRVEAIEADIETIVEDERNVESSQEEGIFLVSEQLRPNEEGTNVGFADLKREEMTLLQNIKESTKNLSDHRKMLATMEKENGHDEDWQAQLSDVKKYTVRHEKYKEITLRRIEEIRKKVKLLKKKVVKDKFVVNAGAVAGAPTSNGDNGTNTSLSSRFAAKRKLNESVLDCGEIVKKIPAKEREAMVPIVLKLEEPACENPYECSFSGCGRSFTSAASLASHLGKHYPAKQAKFDCPFPDCQFTSTQEQLTKHMRSKHTKEQIFDCKQCSFKFHTMDAKVAHEKKHNQPDVWGQCEKEDCLRFYKLAKGHKSCPKN